MPTTCWYSRPVTAFKEAFKDISFPDVDADTLDLYKSRDPVSRPYEESLSKIILSEHAECLQIGLDELSEVFPEAPPKRDIHIIVGM